MELRFGDTRHAFVDTLCNVNIKTDILHNVYVDAYTLFLLHDKEEGIAAALLAKNLLKAMNAKTYDSAECEKLSELME